MGRDFVEWLASDDRDPICVKGKYEQTLQVIKVPRNDAFDYLYCIGWLGSNRSFLDKDYKYSGIYSRKHGLLYDVSYDLREVAMHNSSQSDEEGLQARSREQLLARFKAEVCRKVEDMIGNDRKRLSVAKLQDEWLLQRLNSAREYGAKAAARERFIKDDPVQMPVYQCSFCVQEWDEAKLLAYIDDPLPLVERESADYIAQHQEGILCQFFENDLVEAELKAILADGSLPLHRIKRIMAAVKSVDAKTANVTIKKDGTLFTFKYDASLLARDCGKYYSTYYMAASDRKLFKKKFGEYADFKPEEIERITYGRKTLYQSE